MTTLRLLQDPSANSKLDIPALDRLLATNTPRVDPTNLSSVPAPPIIEITSPVPKSGKTELLYWIVAQLVLGDLRDENAQHYGQTDDSTKDDRGEAADQDRDGQSKNQEDQATNPSEADSEVQDATERLEDSSEHQTRSQTNPRPTSQHPTHPTAIALLTTTPISIPRLAQIILHQTQQLHPPTTLKEAQALTHTALSHIHIFQPLSLPSLISTLSSLPAYFLSPANPSFDRNLVIILDSASAYVWDDKVTTTAAAAGGQKQGLVGKYPALAIVLRRTSAQLQAAVISPAFITPCVYSNLEACFSDSYIPSFSLRDCHLRIYVFVEARDRVPGYD